MSNSNLNLTKLEFTALRLDGENYLAWSLDVILHLAARGLESTIKDSARPPSTSLKTI
jgi:hypothetical protein